VNYLYSSIDLSNNLLVGHIPSWLGNLPKLGKVNLAFNQFSGPFPLGLFKLPMLLVLSLNNNSLDGSLPDGIGDLESLNVLRLDQNNFSGPIPHAIGNLRNLYELNLSRNVFSGDIPNEVGNLQNLQVALDLSYNNLSGQVPSSLGTLAKLEALDLSHNQLTGEVPSNIGEMISLEKLDISYNNFQGALNKRFSRWPYEAFVGNLHLCGASLGSCNHGGASRNRLSRLSEKSVIIISALSTLAAIALLVLAVKIFLRNRQELLKKDSELECVFSSSSSQVQKRPLFPVSTGGRREYRWQEIMDATNNLSDEFIIGSGGSGTVYRVELPTGETVAVKKISLKDEYLLHKSFIREVKTLGRIKHRHLVKLVGCCSNRHKGNGCNLLIYEFMENGSVWDWLHGNALKLKKNLDWDTRFKIALGLAQGMEYLHHDCVPKIIHRDIKSSNILLDSNMDAHLGDFGLAKAIIESLDSNTESTSCFAGSYGYIAPVTYTIDLNCFRSSTFINILKIELDNEPARPKGHGSIALNHSNRPIMVSIERLSLVLKHRFLFYLNY